MQLTSSNPHYIQFTFRTRTLWHIFSPSRHVSQRPVWPNRDGASFVGNYRPGSGEIWGYLPAGEARGHLPVAPDGPPGPRPRRLALPTLTRRRPRTTDQSCELSNRGPASHTPGRRTDPATSAEVGLGLALVGRRGGGLS